VIQVEEDQKPRGEAQREAHGQDARQADPRGEDGLFPQEPRYSPASPAAKTPEEVAQDDVVRRRRWAHESGEDKKMVGPRAGKMKGASVR
jgi:hypothetical protein